MILNEIVEKAGGVGPAILIVAICLNTGLSALSVVLEKIKDLTPTDVDNKLALFVHKILDILKSLTDILSANVKH